VGLLYAYFAWGQRSAISESVRIATTSLLLQFRPRLTVRHVGLLTEPDNMLVPDEAGSLQAVPIEIVLTIANRGGTQGEITDQNITVQVVARTAGLQA